MSLAVITGQSASFPIVAGQHISFYVEWTGIYGSAAVTQWYKNGALFAPKTPWVQTGSTTHPPVAPYGKKGLLNNSTAITDGGYYVLRIYNSSPNTGYVESVPIILTPPPILERIESKIASLVGGMLIANGYNFNWGIVNEQDESLGTFPRCVIDPTDSLADKESNQDTLAGVGSMDYTNEVTFTLLVKGELPVFDTNPLFAIRSLLRKAHDDLKRLFGVHLNLDGECDNIMYMGSQIESLTRNDVQRPAQLRTMWKVVYSQDRQYPFLYAGN